jgi:ABC-2 type transport system permease protein
MALRLPIVSALVRRDFLSTRSYRLVFVLDVGYGVLDLLLYFFISEALADRIPQEDLSGAPSYFAFAAVGIVLGSVLDATSAGVGYRTREEQVTGTLEALTAQPLSVLEQCVGTVGFPFVFAAVRSTLYLVVAAAVLGLDVSETDWLGVMAIVIGAGLAMAPIGILAGAAVVVWKRGHIVSGTLVYGMTILAGMVFPVSALPDWLEPLTRLVPITYAFDGARAAVFTGTGWANDLAALLAWSVVLWPLSVLAFARALAHSKRAGTLAQY